MNQLNFSQKINEIYSRGTASDPDWIEIYNPTSASVDISGYMIYDIGGQSGTKPKKLFPAGSTISGYGYLTIVVDDTAASGFGLSSSGETVWLENAGGTVIDSVVFPTMAVTESYGCAPDGGPMKLLSTITKGKSNIVLTQIILPQYIQGLNGTNNNRTPFVFRVKIDNLLSNTTYRFINQVVISSDGPTTSGAGNVFFVSANVDSPFVRTSSPDMNSGPYGLLTTDATGSYTGWFITEPTGNASRFIPGKYLFMRIRLNDGATGTTAVNWATTTDSIKVINYGTTSDTSLGTGIYGRSFAAPKDFIFLYDNVDGTGRPLSSAIVEVDGINLNAITSVATFYRDSVDQFVGAWGTIIPNQLTNGVRRIERRLFADGSIFPVIGIDDNGIWPSGANTVNPLGGLTPIRIESSDAPIPVELTSFSVSIFDSKIKLNWETATETNNMGFEIQRKNTNEFQKIGYVEGKINSTEKQKYDFTDANAVNGKNIYRLKQIDLDGTSSYSKIIEIDLTAPFNFALEQNYPNPFNPATTIGFTIPTTSNVSLKIFNVLGKEVTTLVNETKSAGNYSVRFNATGLSSGIYFYKLTTDNFTATKKFTLLK